jgi:hypothetical protein
MLPPTVHERLDRVIRCVAVASSLSACALACATGSHSSHPGGSGGPGGGGSGSGGFGMFGGRSADGGRLPRCNSAGNCTCFNIASIGHPGCTGCEAAGGGGDSTTSFVDYLNQNSSAAVDLYTSKPMLTADFLAQYDVIILQGLFDGACDASVNYTNTNFWSFGSDELTALKAWLAGGGGLITLSGFLANSSETQPMNTVLGALTNNDLTYGTDDVCSQTGVYCLGESLPLGGWGQDAIGQKVQEIGCFHGRPVQVGSGSQAVIDDQDGQYVYAAHEQVGAGYVVVYEDEWITYTSQWPGGVAGPTCEQGCAADAEPGAVYQVPQLWQNMINYAASSTSCPPFMISVTQ